MNRILARSTAVSALVIALGVSGVAMAAKKPSKHAFTRTLHGANIAPNQSVEKVSDSLNGNGAAVVSIKVVSVAPLTLMATVTTYFANGVSRTTDVTVQSPPDAQGMSTLKGAGKCDGGTGVHKTEKCTFKTTGTYNTKTGTDTLTWSGTVTR